MRSFSVSSLLNQTTTTYAVDQLSPLSSSRPAVLDISNLLCSTTVTSKEVCVPTTMPLLASPTSSSNCTPPSPLSASSANTFQVPPISNTWSAAAATPSVHHHSSLPPPIPKSIPLIETNSIWMHDSMASSVSSVGSNTTLSSCGSMEAITTATPSTSTVRNLPLKKQPYFQPQHHHTSTNIYTSSSASTKCAYYDDDLESTYGFGTSMLSSDEEPASPSNSQPAIKTKRRRANAKQLEILNRVFDRTVFPSTQLRAELGRQLGMTPRTVQIWFQNRRQAIRTREQERVLRIICDEHQLEDTSSS